MHVVEADSRDEVEAALDAREALEDRVLARQLVDEHEDLRRVAADVPADRGPAPVDAPPRAALALEGPLPVPQADHEGAASLLARDVRIGTSLVPEGALDGLGEPLAGVAEEAGGPFEDLLGAERVGVGTGPRREDREREEGRRQRGEFSEHGTEGDRRPGTRKTRACGPGARGGGMVRIEKPEVFGVTDSSVTLAFDVRDGQGPVDAEARVRVDGEVRAVSTGPAATRLVRIEGLDPGRRHRLSIEVDGGEAPAPDPYFPEAFETLAQPAAREVASFATLNDLHFGELRFGGVIDDAGEPGPDGPGCPSVRADDTEIPYWRFMNEDAIDEINSAGVDATLVKGDIADRGLPEQFAMAAEAFARLRMPLHAFLGNHDHYGRKLGLEVDGYALLGQPRAPRSLDLGGWRLVLVETADPGEHHGVFGDDRLRRLDEMLAETRETSQPTLVLMHHHPVPPENAHTFPNTIGIRPDQSLRLYDLVGRHPQVRGVLLGHTHRNRVRLHPASGETPWVEVHCTKDYPGGWAHYRLFEDGSFRQEVRRTSSPRALAHSAVCRDFFRGFYRVFALGTLPERSFAVQAR